MLNNVRDWVRGSWGIKMIKRLSMVWEMGFLLVLVGVGGVESVLDK